MVVAKNHGDKGTGRARHGSNRSPIWRGGGTVFGPTGNENYSLKMNKEHDLALRSALSLLVKNSKLIVLQDRVKLKQKQKPAVDLTRDSEQKAKFLSSLKIMQT